MNSANHDSLDLNTWRIFCYIFHYFPVSSSLTTYEVWWCSVRSFSPNFLAFRTIHFYSIWKCLEMCQTKRQKSAIKQKLERVFLNSLASLKNFISTKLKMWMTRYSLGTASLVFNATSRHFAPSFIKCCNAPNTESCCEGGQNKTNPCSHGIYLLMEVMAKTNKQANQ